MQDNLPQDKTASVLREVVAKRAQVEPPVEAIQGEARGYTVVIPADREAWIQYEDFDGAFADRVRTGSEDNTCGLQIIARHRLAFQSEARAVPSDGERIQTLPTDTVQAVTEAILREAREHGAGSPVDRGDAEQLAMAAVGAMPAHQADREAIAEALWNVNNHQRYSLSWERAKAENHNWVKGCYMHADAVVNLSPTPSAGRDGLGALPSCASGHANYIGKCPYCHEKLPGIPASATKGAAK